MGSKCSDFQLRLEWARKKISNVVCEINSYQVTIERIHQRIFGQLSVIRQLEERITVESLQEKNKHGQEAYNQSKPYTAMFLSTLYAKLALDLESDIDAWDSDGTFLRETEPSGGKLDIFKEYYKEILQVSYSYLHVVSAYRHQLEDKENKTMLCMRRDVKPREYDLLDVLKIIFHEDSSGLREIFKGFINTLTRPESQNSDTPISIKDIIPREFRQCVDRKWNVLRDYLIPQDALLLTGSHDHLVPAAWLQNGIQQILDIVTSQGESVRCEAKQHQCVLNNAEVCFNEKRAISDPLLAKDLVYIMDYYSKKRLQGFYADCFYKLIDVYEMFRKKFTEKCGCMENIHLSVSPKNQ